MTRLLFLVVACLAGSIAEDLHTADAPAFTVGREYIYDFESRFGTGVFKDINQFSGAGLAGQLVIQNQGDHVFVQLRNVKSGQFNEHIDHDYREHVKITYEDPHEGPAMQFAEAIQKPFSAHFERGVVTSFEVLAEEPEQVVNVKRAILSLLQLNLDRVNLEKRDKYQYNDEEENKDFYRVLEDGIGGVVETVYEIHSQKYYRRPFERVLNVTKTRLYDKSVTRPTYLQSSYLGYQKADYNTRNFDPLRTLSQTDYHIRGDRRFFVIEAINNVGEIIFTPFTTNGETIITIVNQTLTLKETHPIQEQITLPGNLVTYNSLTYATPKVEEGEVDLAVANLYKFPSTFQDKHQKVEDLIFDLVQEWSVGENLSEKKLPQKLVVLIRFLRTYDFAQLEQLYGFEVSDEDKRQKRVKGLLLDILPYLGSNPSVKYLLKLVETRGLPDKVLGKLFEVVPFYVREASKQLIDEIIRVANTLQSDERRDLKSVLLLAAGSIISRAAKTVNGYTVDAHQVKGRQYDVYPQFSVPELKNNRFPEENPEDALSRLTSLNLDPLNVVDSSSAKPQQDAVTTSKLQENLNNLRRQQKTGLPLDTVRQYNKVFEALAQGAQDDHDLILYLRVLSNIGLPESFPVIKQVVKNKDKPEVVRATALFALYPLSRQLRDEILNLAVPLFYDYHEENALRISAFQLILSVKPTFEALHNIGRELQYEPYQEVSSFVYNTFLSLANSTNPVHRSLSNDVREVLELIPPVKLGLQHSQHKILNYFNNKYQFGKQLKIETIGSNTSIIPESVSFKTTVQALGYNFDILNFGVYAKGLKKLYERFFGPMGYTENEEFSTLYTRRHARQVDTVQKELDEIRQQLHLKFREDATPELSVFYKTFNKNVRFEYFDENAFSTGFENGINKYVHMLPRDIVMEGADLSYAKYGLLLDVTYKIPTEAGLPYVINLVVPSVSSVSGSLNFDVARNIEMTTDVKIKMLKNAILTVGVKSPSNNFYAYGNIHDLTVQLPLKLNVDADFYAKKLKVKYQPTQANYKPVSYKAKPFTVISNLFDGLPITDEPNITYLHYTDKPVVDKVTLGKKFFGTGWTVYQKHEQHGYNGSKLFDSFREILSQEDNHFNYDYDHIPTFLTRFYEDFVGVKDYFMLQPTFKPYKFGVAFEPDTANPTNEIEFSLDFDLIKNGKNVYGDDHQEEDREEGSIPTEGKFRKTYVLNAELHTTGAKPRQFKANLKYVSSPGDDQNNKLSFEYERTPVPEYDEQPFKFNLHRTVKLSGVPANIHDYSIDYDLEPVLEKDYEATFGPTGSERKISFKVKAERSDEQKSFNSHPSAYSTYDSYQAYQADGRNLTFDAFQYFIDFYNLNKQTVHVTYENLPQSVIYLKRRVTNLIRYLLYPNYDVQSIGVNNPEGQIHAEFNFHTNDPRLDVSVQMPHENVTYYNIPYNFYLPLFIRYNSRLSYGQLLQYRLFRGTFWAQCLLQDKEVLTFDWADYKTDLSTCYHILFKDGSHQEKFTALIKKVENNAHVTKALKLFVDNHKVEILPVGENAETAPLVVRIDGVKQVVDEQHKYVIQNPGKRGVLLKVFKIPGNYIIDVPKYGFQIFFNGVNVYTEATNFFRGRVIGLCGEVNGELSREFTGPDGYVYYDSEDFVNSYAIRDGSCNAGPVDEENRYLPENEEVEIQERVQGVIRRNKVIRNVTPKPLLGRSKPDSVCFSTIPIPECAEGYKATEVVQRRVGFYCLNAKDEVAGNLTKFSQLRELTELVNKTPDYYEVQSYPEECVKVPSHS